MRSALALLALVAAAAGGVAAQALRATEIDIGAAVAFARRDFLGVAMGVARRAAGSQGRVGLVVAGGTLGGRLAGRLEATVQFVVTPAARSGVTPYGAMGVAYLAARGRRGAVFMTVSLGLEKAAGRRRGWFAEVGLGGGLRARLGYRWRRFPAWWR